MPQLDAWPAIAGHSMTARRLRHDIGRLAPRWMAVLIDGPPGAGHFDVARALHGLGPRRRAPLARFDALAHPAGRAVALLAEAARQAGGGALFVDHADLMPRPAQERLEGLAVEGAVGDGSHVNARIIVGAQGAGLIPMLAEALRDRVTLPPLTARLEDLGPIAAAVLSRVGSGVRLAPDALAPLAAAPDLPTLTAALIRAAAHAEGGQIPARVVRRVLG